MVAGSAVAGPVRDASMVKWGPRVKPEGKEFRVARCRLLEHSRLERFGEEQAACNASEDQREIGGAEADRCKQRLGDGALPDGGGDFAAVADQLADQVEQTAAAAGLGGWGWGFGRG
jgi:hypothetical protein